MRHELMTYWQVYAALAVSALAAYWAGWWCCLLANPTLAGRHRRARAARRAERAQLPAPLPALPASAAAALDVRHANVMARTAPHEVRPLARAWAGAASVVGTLAVAGTAARTVSRWTADRESPWQDATGTFPAVMAELEAAQDDPAPEGIPA